MAILSAVISIYVYNSKHHEQLNAKVASVRQEMYERFSLREDIEKRLASIEQKIDKLFDRGL